MDDAAVFGCDGGVRDRDQIALRGPCERRGSASCQEVRVTDEEICGQCRMPNAEYGGSAEYIREAGVNDLQRGALDQHMLVARVLAGDDR